MAYNIIQYTIFIIKIQYKQHFDLETEGFMNNVKYYELQNVS